MDNLRKNAKPKNTVLYGELVPAPGAPSSTPSMTVAVPVTTWSLYAHTEERYQGLWLHSRYGNYHLLEPAEEYAPFVNDFAQCVRYVVAIHLCVTMTVGDSDDVHELELDMLLELMTEAKLDRNFIQEHGAIICDLLRDLKMNKKYAFMVALSKMGHGHPTPVVAAPPSSFASSPSSSSSSSVASTDNAAASLAAAAAAAAGEKKRRKRKTGATGGASWTGMGSGGGGGGGVGGGAGCFNTNTEDDAMPVLGPDCPALRPHLSDEVVRALNTLEGQNNRLSNALRDERMPEVLEKMLGEFEKILNTLEQENFEPMYYLLAGTFGGEAFFQPLFDLYRHLKRVRLTCPEHFRARVAALRVRLVEDFTTKVLKDVWYIQNRGSVRTQVRAMKEEKKAKWVKAKFERLKRERKEAQQLKVKEKEAARKAQVERRKERAQRRQEWKRDHAARKEQKAQEKADRKAAAREGKLAATAMATTTTTTTPHLEVEVDDPRGEKRAASEEAEGGRASKRGGEEESTSPLTSRDSSMMSSSNQKEALSPSCKATNGLLGAEESKCTLSPMLYGSSSRGASASSSSSGANGASWSSSSVGGARNSTATL